MRFLAKILSVACWFWVGGAAVTPSLAAKGTLEEQQAEVRTMRDQVLADLYRRDASLREKNQSSGRLRGVFQCGRKFDFRERRGR